MTYSVGQGSTDQNQLVPDREVRSSVLGTRPNQDQAQFRNVGLNRTRTEKNFKTWDRTRTKKNFQISDRTMTTKILKIPVPGPVDPWCGSKTILFRD